jgi:oxygen-independent coproporphyrinogen-3 oxidase
VVCEFADRRAVLRQRCVGSLYIGGAGASRLGGSEFVELVDRVGEAVTASDGEYSLEVDPVDVSPRRIDTWRQAGVTRLVVECGGLEGDKFEQLGRGGSVEEVRRGLDLIFDDGGFSVGIDLTFGLPGESEADWQAELERLESYPQLDALFGEEYTGEGGGASAAMLEGLCRRASALGLRRYEPASFARPGRESRQNSLYFTGGEYLGLGAGASSLAIPERRGVVRRSNQPEVDAYLEAVPDGGLDRRIGPEDYLVERLTLAMYTRFGLDLEKADRQFDDCRPRGRIDEMFDTARAVFNDWVGRELIEAEGSHYRPTSAGLSVADGLARRLAAQLG